MKITEDQLYKLAGIVMAIENNDLNKCHEILDELSEIDTTSLREIVTHAFAEIESDMEDAEEERRSLQSNIEN